MSLAAKAVATPDGEQKKNLFLVVELRLGWMGVNEQIYDCKFYLKNI